MRVSRLVMTITLAMAAAGACSDPVLAPFQPEITNVPGNFQFQITAAQGVTATREYVWQNSATTANIDKSSAISAGTATLTVLDAQGAQVHSSSLTTNGSLTTSAGTAGNWTIRVTLTNVSGAVNFRVQTP